MRFCDKQSVDPLQPPLPQFLEFLTALFHSGLGYSALNTARSAVSSFICTIHSDNQIGAHPLVKRFMAGVFNEKPALPRYNVTWDVTVVLNFLRTQAPVRRLPLLPLTRKLAMLLLLLSGHRGQSLLFVDIRNIRATDHNIKITFGDSLKHTRPGCHTAELVIPAYPADRRLCICTVMQEYRRRTDCLRREHVTSLFLTSIKPHGPATRDTISKWIKTVLKLSGIDISVFAPHSVRAASTSAAKVSLPTILRTACWSKENTFQRYYNKPLISETLGGGVLKAAK